MRGRETLAGKHRAMNERPVNPFDTHYYPKKGDDFWKLIELMQKGLPVTE
jgi:hypothetical protein